MNSLVRVLLTAVALLTWVPAASAQDTYRILPADFNANKEQQMMRAFLRAQVHDAMDRRRRELEAALESPEHFAAYQQRRREFLHRTWGEMPPRTPLNARVTGTVNDEGFVIEKVLFESQPGFFVTGNLYRPAGDGPFPAILHPCGHSENGKAAGPYQQANQLLARHGFIVFCYDPIGQGERKQLFSADGAPTHRASSEHQELGVAAILLGRSLGGYMVWDGIRAIDYLCSRPDVDTQRIGCTGNSGGGNLTSYLMAYDDRIVAAAPGCFMTTHRRKNESPGPGDAEQNLFAQIREGFDHPDFILSRAPKPTLILAATQDFVPIEGTWEAYRQAKRVYTQLGYPERIALIETNAQHGFTRRLREGMVRFFAQWLQGRQLEVSEADDAVVHSDADIRVTPTGQVGDLDGNRSILDLYAEYEDQLARRRPELTRERVRSVTGVRQLTQLPEPEVDIMRDDEMPRKYVLRPEPGIVLPAWYWPEGDHEPVLIAHEAGIDAAAALAQELQFEGHPVLVVDVRATGETATRNWRFHGADYYIAYMLGRNWLAMRCEDLLVCARWLAQQQATNAVRLLAVGEPGPAALHAAALEPDWISSVQVDRGLASWRSLMPASDAHQHVHQAVHGALEVYDLPDLKPLLNK